MPERIVTVRNPVGLHARPAAQFVEAARQYECSISIVRNGKNTNAKSLLKVLALGIKQNTVFTLVTSGAGEKEALDSLCDLLESL
ncbi:MAG: HPr family phosphocarrier protein [Anaerolineales bacterium]|nr:HPr family phosphocarrier protein [Anaerolineales bacterium]